MIREPNIKWVIKTKASFSLKSNIGQKLDMYLKWFMDKEHSECADLRRALFRECENVKPGIKQST